MDCACDEKGVIAEGDAGRDYGGRDDTNYLFEKKSYVDMIKLQTTSNREQFCMPGTCRRGVT